MRRFVWERVEKEGMVGTLRRMKGIYPGIDEGFSSRSIGNCKVLGGGKAEQKYEELTVSKKKRTVSQLVSKSKSVETLTKPSSW